MNVSQYDEGEHVDVFARDREAWNLPAPKVRGLDTVQAHPLGEDRPADDSADPPELESAA